MAPNFALSLSFDGISLLQRAENGWLTVGETALDVPDLGAALAKMRANAATLAPEGMQTKLIIPTEQIKYVTLETAQTSEEDVMAALDGATPYAVSELVTDHDRNGGRTFIAAVARETLAEAEAFAVEHDFNPVCFAAVPDIFTFRGEVFFGLTEVANSNGISVERDAVAAVSIGHADVAPEPLADDAVVFASRARTSEPTQKHDTGEEQQPEATPTSEPDQPEIAEAPEAEVEPAAEAPVAPPVLSTEPPAPQMMAPPVAAPTDDAIPTPPPIAAPVRAEEIAASGGFRSRRAGGAAISTTPVTAKTVPPNAHPDQAFATKQSPAGTGRRLLPLILTIILLLFMAAVGWWASTLPPQQLSRWLGFATSAPTQTTLNLPEHTVTQPLEVEPLEAELLETEPLETERSETELLYAEPLATELLPEIVVDAAPDDEVQTPIVISEPVLPQVTSINRVLSPAEASRIYAATGVWQRAPRFTLLPRTAELDFAPLAGISAFETFFSDALITPETLSTDQRFLTPSNPPAFGEDYARGDDGFIAATLDGVRNQVGILVYTRAPDVMPRSRPSSQAPTTEDAPTDTLNAERLPDRPETAPQEAVPELSLALANVRPRVRPEGLIPPAPATPVAADVAAVAAAIAGAAPDLSDVAIANAARPDARPNNFIQLVARAKKNEAARAASAVAAAARVPTETVAPSGPVPGDVARAATMENAIKLRSVNLIGVYGKPSARRALVRLSNGKFVKVQVGSNLDGGRVTAIGENALKYTKRGKSISLEMPTS